MTGMPRLSKDLPHDRSPDRCQACGVVWAELETWTEADDFDDFPKGSPLVVLCAECSKALIEKHQRLYRQEERHKPIPGAMNLCVGCDHRQGLDCKSPDAFANGGKGIEIKHPQPTRMHVLRSPRRHSGWVQIFNGPATSCSGRVASGNVTLPVDAPFKLMP